MPREPSGWKPDPQSGSWHWYFAALLLFVCALLSKTVTCSLPVALLLVQWWKKGRLCRSDAVPLVPFFVIGAGLGLLTVWMEKHHVQAQGEDWSQNFVERCLIAGRVLWFYAGKLAWPAQLTFVYPRWEIDTGAWQQWLFPVFAVVAVAVCWLIRGRIDRGPFVAVLFFAATLCPAMGFIDVYPMRYSFVADHFQYLAGIGLIALITAGLGRSRNYFGALVLPVLLILTWRQTHTYRDAETLWRDTLVKNPSCWMAHNNLGLLLKRRGDWEEAETHLREALKLKPASHEYLNNLGQVLANRQKFAEAITCYESALKLAPADTFVHYNFANTLFELGRIDEAIDHYRKAIQSGPDYPLVHDRLGIALLTKGETDEAMIQFGEELRVNPDNAQVCYKLGLLLAAKGEKPEAIVRLREAVRLKPDSVEYLNSLAWLLATAADGRLRNGAEAIGFARRAADLSQFKNPFVLDTLAAAYAESGRFAEAVETAQMAAALATAADKETAAGIAARLDIYRSGQAYKE
jgi:tetratricopeptide (TPR) repeat protein